jgi:succinylglutamate desuccinylase
MKNINKILLVGGLHGDEPTGIKVAKYFKKNKVAGINSILANTKAIREKQRYIETDLNRSFSVTVPISYEEVLAVKIAKELKEYDLILDFHNSVANGTNCSIVTCKPNKLHIHVSALLGFDNLLIMPPSGSLIGENSEKSISIEIAYDSVKQYSEKKLINKIKNLNINNTIQDNVKIYKYIATIKKPTIKRVKINLRSLKNFVELTTDQKNKLQLNSKIEYCPVFARSNYTKDHGFMLVQRQN